MRIPGLKSLRQGTRWIRSRFSGGALILGYHRIAEDVDDVFSQCVRPEFFAQQLQVLREQANPISLDRLLDYMRVGSIPPRSVILTFDDGYADNLHCAWPWLRQYEIPATFFITTGYLGQNFWWDELAWMILNGRDLPDPITLHVHEQSAVSFTVQQDRLYLLAEIYKRILAMTATQRQQAMSYLREHIAPDTAEIPESLRASTPAELNVLAGDDLAAIGGHTVSHPNLTQLPVESQRLEIEGCKQDLERIISRPVKAFSYPHGAGSERVRALVRQAGFEYACTSCNDVSSSQSDPFNLPRFWVADHNGQDFARWLNRWL